MIVNKETMRRRFNPLASYTVWDDKFLYVIAPRALWRTAVRDEGDDLSLDIGNTIRIKGNAIHPKENYRQ